jgi:hypothetical protein
MILKCPESDLLHLPVALDVIPRKQPDEEEEEDKDEDEGNRKDDDEESDDGYSE